MWNDFFSTAAVNGFQRGHVPCSTAIDPAEHNVVMVVMVVLMVVLMVVMVVMVVDVDVARGRGRGCYSGA